MAAARDAVTNAMMASRPLWPLRPESIIHTAGRTSTCKCLKTDTPFPQAAVCLSVWAGEPGAVIDTSTRSCSFQSLLSSSLHECCCVGYIKWKFLEVGLLGVGGGGWGVGRGVVVLLLQSFFTGIEMEGGGGGTSAAVSSQGLQATFSFRFWPARHCREVSSVLVPDVIISEIIISFSRFQGSVEINILVLKKVCSMSPDPLHPILAPPPQLLLTGKRPV